MRPTVRRRIDPFLLAGASAVIGVGAVIAAFAGDTERIGAYWTHAHIDPGGAEGAGREGGRHRFAELGPHGEEVARFDGVVSNDDVARCDRLARA